MTVALPFRNTAIAHAHLLSPEIFRVGGFKITALSLQPPLPPRPPLGCRVLPTSAEQPKVVPRSLRSSGGEPPLCIDVTSETKVTPKNGGQHVVRALLQNVETGRKQARGLCASA